MLRFAHSVFTVSLSVLVVWASAAIGSAQNAAPAPKSPQAAQTPAAQPAPAPQAPEKPPAPVAPQTHLAAVPFDQVKLHEGFWGDKLKTNRNVTIEACLKKCEETGRIKNFAVAGGLEKGKHEGELYNDSDVYKVLEGVAYTLAIAKDPALEARADAIIEKIAAAQQKDGYLDTYYTLVEPEKHWTNIKSGHELYCAGHLFEAAVAYDRATGKKKLLDVAKKLADHIDKTFGPGKKLDPPGHPEIELALVKLYKATNEPRYLALAKFFIDQRGNLKPPSKDGKDEDDAKDDKKDDEKDPVKRAENARKRAENALKRKRPGFGEYAQDDKPLRQQTEIVGHAVRAMYLFSGAADVAAETGDNTLIAPLETIWHDVVDKKMYITGGIGSSAKNEGFTKAYDLPNDTAYCETCAAIGMALWNQRMLLLTGEAKYADIVEKELYNAILAGVSHSGDAFFYDNPLESRGDKKRVPWFDCSCCPSNLERFLPSIPGLVFATKGNSVYVCQYISCDTTLDVAGAKVHITMKTDWPDVGKVEFSVNPDRPVTFALKLRRPATCKRVVYQHDIKEHEHDKEYPGDEAGWELYERKYEPNDFCAAAILAPVRLEHAATQVEADKGRVAVCRGPLVYALEGVDNPSGVFSAVLPVVPKDAPLPSVDARADPVFGMTRFVKAKGQSLVRGADGKGITSPASLRFLPYYQWANRGPSEMRVWVPETPELAEVPPAEPSADQNGAHITVSHCWRGDTVLALNDGKIGAKSSDASVPRMTFWYHTGTQEWAQYEFAAPKKLSSSRVFWYDDTGTGGTRVPIGWRLSWLDGVEWKPVILKSGGNYETALDAWNSVEFDPVQTTALRLEVDLQRGYSAGVLEWEVH